MLKTPLGRLRLLSIIEGISYFILVAIAMPLKYFAGQTTPVAVVGSIHGWVYMFFFLALVHVVFVHRWSIKQIFWAIVASFVPLGTFVLEARIRHDEEAKRAV